MARKLPRFSTLRKRKPLPRTRAEKRAIDLYLGIREENPDWRPGGCIDCNRTPGIHDGQFETVAWICPSCKELRSSRPAVDTEPADQD